MTTITPEACRAARALLGLTVREIGDAAGIAFETISKYENGRSMREANRAKLQEAFEARGVEILNGNSPGARLTPRADGATP